MFISPGGRPIRKRAASITNVNNNTTNVNRVINPMGQFAQAGLASTGNAAYTGFDQWYALVQTAAITPSQLTNVENGTPFMMRLTQAQAAAQRFGLAQPFESARVIDLRGKTVSLRARINCSVSTTIRWAVVEWTGTADTITKSIVNNWASTIYTPGNFFIATTTTVVGTGSVAVTANTLTDAISNAIGTVSSSMNNLIVFFWTDSTQAQNVTLDIGNVWFGAGVTTPNSFEPPLNNKDLAACQRYWFALPLLMPMNVQGTGDLTCIVQYPVQMRISPTIDLSNLTNANYVNTAPTGVQWSLLKQGVAFATKTGTVTVSGITNTDLNQAGFAMRGATWSVAPENVDVATPITCSARL